MSLRSRLAGLSSVLKYDNRFHLLVNRLFFRRRPLVYQTGGLSIFVSHEGMDQSGVHPCLWGGMYSGLLGRSGLRRDPVVFDLGGNVGGFVLSLLKDGYRPSKVVSVEMNPNTHRRLWFNLSNNYRGDLSVVWGAVAPRKGSMDLYLGKGSTGDSLREALREGEGKVRYRVPLWTLDGLYREYFGPHRPVVDLAKMDIEGAEHAIFSNKGGWKCIRRFRFFLIEIHGEEGKRGPLVEAIRQEGFEEVAGGERREVFFFRNTRLAEAPALRQGRP